jgi:site-specific DNA-cytosine methylase
MKVLIACEFSGRVRDAFLKYGHDAVSCDLLPTEKPGPHLQCDVRKLDLSIYDLMICHPPCTHLAVSGARWFPEKIKEQKEALDFIRFLLNSPVNKICLENPVSIISSVIRKPDQIIHPWQFGDDTNKKTCLWLKNLPKLVPTDIVPKIFRDDDIHLASQKNRWKNRSRTFKGIAEAMAQQWGNKVVIQTNVWTTKQVVTFPVEC